MYFLFLIRLCVIYCLSMLYVIKRVLFVFPCVRIITIFFLSCISTPLHSAEFRDILLTETIGQNILGLYTSYYTSVNFSAMDNLYISIRQKCMFYIFIQSATFVPFCLVKIKDIVHTELYSQK